MDANQTRVAINNRYGYPVTAPPPYPNAVVINQQSPTLLLRPDQYKSTPVCATCPSCHQTMTTVITKKCNCCACLLCWLTGVVFFVCIQMCRGKDLCCCDVDHTCPRCNALVGSYTPC